MNTAATTVALEAKASRLPRLRKAAHTARFIAALTWVWVEAWPAALIALAVVARFGVGSWGGVLGTWLPFITLGALLVGAASLALANWMRDQDGPQDDKIEQAATVGHRALWAAAGSFALMAILSLPLPTTLAVAVAVATWIRAYTTGALAKNVTDTIAEVVRWDWRCTELDTWQLPHLIGVTIADPVALRDLRTLWRHEGWRAIPAAHTELVVRPNDSQGAAGWEHRFTDHVARRYGYETPTVLPAADSINCLSITLGRRQIPDYVGS